MHELKLVKDLFSDLIRHASQQNAKKILAVNLRMGEFSEINEEIVRFYFKENSKGTIVEGAQINIEKSPTRELRLVSFDCE